MKNLMSMELSTLVIKIRYIYYISSIRKCFRIEVYSYRIKHNQDKYMFT